MPTDHRKPTLNQTQVDHLELDATEVSPGTAKFLSLAFALILFFVPVSQAVVEIGRSQWPQALSLFQPFATGVRHAAAGNLEAFWRAWLDGIKPETLHSYEAAVENNSIFGMFFQPRTQQILTGWLGAGNDKVVLGRGGWIFYLPGLDYVVGPSVADRATFDRAAQKMVNARIEASPHPDPRPALLEFDRECRNAGIRLIVVPVPDKVMMQPAQLYSGAGGLERVPVPNNVGYARLVEEMRANGVNWFEPAPQYVRPTDVRYLSQDTHWTPDYMSTVARDLAAQIRETGGLSEATPVPLHVVHQQVSRVGDLVDMLSLTKQQAIFRPETVTIQRVIDDRSGQAVVPDPEADVLLLGDSFTNIYSESAMGWGSGAGFGQHLAFHLRRPIDVIAFNGGGATQVRAELARRENGVRLGFKKVIVYQFAIRSLLSDNWERLPMVVPVRPAVPAPVQEGSAPPALVRQAPPSKSVVKRPAPTDAPLRKTPAAATGATTANLVVVGRIVQTSKVPAPGTAPYKDCLTFIKVHIEAVESGTYGQQEMLVVFLAMKDNEWLPAASYAVGDRLRMRVIPFTTAGPDIRGLRRVDDTGEYTLRSFYVLEESRQ